MNNQYNDYVLEVQRQVETKNRNGLINSTSSVISELISVAERNQESLTIFKGVDKELSASVEYSGGNFNELNGLLSSVREGLDALPGLKSSINSLLLHPITVSNKGFQSMANELINKAYTTMGIAEIGSTKQSMQGLIEEMRQFEINQKRAKEERRKRIISYALKGGGIAIGLYLIISFVIPFVLEWWWVLLIVLAAIGWLASKFSS